MPLRPLFRLLRTLLFLAPLLGAASADPVLDRYATVTTAAVSTWIYVGKVTLIASPFHRAGSHYVATYTAKVFPYLFFSESGSMTVNVSDDSLRQLAAGKPIDFSGTAIRSDGTARPIDGTATPSGALGGAIKVKIHLNRKVTLVFDTTYRVADPVKASAGRPPGSPPAPG